jgi:hypothetical protein
LPLLPSPYDAHTIDNYEQDLPVLYVDVTNNSLDHLSPEMFLSSSTQDKYILSIDMRHNHLQRWNFSLVSFSEGKRRIPFIEVDVADNPLQCDCHLHETLLSLFKYDPFYQKMAASTGK